MKLRWIVIGCVAGYCIGWTLAQVLMALAEAEDWDHRETHAWRSTHWNPMPEYMGKN